MNNDELIPHLFRTEYRKLVAVLARRFGLERLDLAEDIASDTFLTATEAWGLKGIPPNPTAWLYHVAKNKAKNHLLRDRLFENKIAVELRQSSAESYEPEIDLSPHNINDSQLQMMFALCHPAIPPEAQVGLSLRILCGFGIDEIAEAFLTNKETINKRLFRAKEKLREEHIAVEMPPPSEIGDRLDAVLRTIYLLFNEGYYSSTQNVTIRKDLCLEAMRLCSMLIENEETNTPEANALLALMCFHGSRFEARIDSRGELVLYDEQDTSLWNTDLISKGGYFLNRSAVGNRVSRYHLEAGIAYWHTIKADSKEKWESILQLYNQLLQLEYSPVAALNRTYALAKAHSKQEAIVEAEKLGLEGNHFYHALLGELYAGVDRVKSRTHFLRALSIAKTAGEKNALQKKVDAL